MFLKTLLRFLVLLGRETLGVWGLAIVLADLGVLFFTPLLVSMGITNASLPLVLEAMWVLGAFVGLLTFGWKNVYHPSFNAFELLGLSGFFALCGVVGHVPKILPTDQPSSWLYATWSLWTAFGMIRMGWFYAGRAVQPTTTVNT